MGRAGDYPDVCEGWSDSDWCPRAVAHGTAGLAVGRDSDWGGPAQNRGGTRLHRTRTHVTSVMARPRLGWDPMPANPGTSRRWPATAGLADPGRLMTPIPTSGRNIWERPGMSRHRGPSPVSREQRLMAAGWTAPDGGPGGVSAWLPESTRDSGRMPAGRDGPDAVTRRRNSGSPRLGVRWRSGVR